MQRETAMSEPRRGLVVVMMGLVAMGLMGCASPSGSAAKAQQSADKATAGLAQLDPNTDPTAIRLHELAGALLEYQVRHGRYPAKLSELKGSMAEGQSVTVDPATGKMFEYSSGGRQVEGFPGRLIAWQPTGRQVDVRWGLFAGPAGPGQAALYVEPVPVSKLAGTGKK